ncbi:hypothetical protein ABBQ38_005490 [Trebouxia sp. C0009 RCD-2024]
MWFKQWGTAAGPAQAHGKCSVFLIEKQPGRQRPPPPRPSCGPHKVGREALQGQLYMNPPSIEAVPLLSGYTPSSGTLLGRLSSVVTRG